MKRWPGVHFVKSILGGKPLKGLWFNRTEEYAAKNRGEDFGCLKYAEEEELKLSQLPCWADLTPEQYRERIAELIEEIEAEAAPPGTSGTPSGALQGVLARCGEI